jgi:hypothetical protein
MTLPEIRIPWWDNEESAWKEAVLPAQSINILEAESSASLAPPESFAAPTEIVVEQVETAFFSSIWFWSTAAFAFLSLILALMLIAQPKQKANREPAKERDTKEQQLWKTLQRELKNGSAHSLRTALENWCRTVWPDESASALQKLAEKLSGDGARELSDLERAIYGKPGAEPPSLKSLEAQLKLLRKNAGRPDSPREALPPLNPI